MAIHNTVDVASAHMPGNHSDGTAEPDSAVEASSVSGIDSGTTAIGEMTPTANADTARLAASGKNSVGLDTIQEELAATENGSPSKIQATTAVHRATSDSEAEPSSVTIKDESSDTDFSMLTTTSANAAEVSLPLEACDQARASDEIQTSNEVQTSDQVQESNEVEASIHKTSGRAKIIPVVNVVSFHIDADMYVKVHGPHGYNLYKVHSALIAAASPVWRKQIYGGQYSRPAKGKWIVEMLDPEDSDFGVDMVFSIIHYKFHDLPERPSVEQLYDIARVVYKNECSHLLVPFMQAWVTGLNWHVIMNDSCHSNDDDITLFVTWVFGEARWFSKCVSRVAYKATIDEDGNLLDARGQRWDKSGLPAQILDMIRAARMSAVDKIFPAIEIPFQQLLNGPRDTSKKFCRAIDAADETKEQCQLLQLGSLMSGLTMAGLLPVPKAETYRGSVIDLAKKILGIKLAHFKIPGIRPHQDAHHSCGIQHEKAVEDAMPSMIQMRGQLIRELRLRARKSGAYSKDLFTEVMKMEEQDPSSVADYDLRRDITHYKQLEDFNRTPDYYSETYTDVVVKDEKVDT